MASVQSALAANPQADGIVDLSSHGFENGAGVALKHGWTVYRGRIIDPRAFLHSGCVLPDEMGAAAETVSAPDLWGPAITDTVRSGHGQATYCLNLMLPEDQKFYAIRMGTLRSVSAIYAVFTGISGDEVAVLLHQNGRPAGGPDQVVNNPAPPLLTVPFATKTLRLVVQVSNNIHKQGGMVEVPVIDLKWRLDSRQNRETALPSALVIVLLLVSVGAFIVGLRYEDSRGHNIFALLTLTAALRVLFVSDVVWDYAPSFPLERKYDLEYLTLFLLAAAYYAFITFLFRPGKILKIDYVIYGISALLSVFALFIAPFMAPGTITLVREGVQILWVIIAGSVAYIIFRSFLHNPEQNREALVVISAGLMIVVYEILSVTGLISASLEWSQFMIIAVTLMHSRAFVINSRRIERERDELTRSLQQANQDLQNRAIALDLALMRAEEASRAKSDFLATVSHELRTPLNAVIGFSELMMREVFGPLGSPRYVDYAGDIKDSGTHLLALVNDILDLSRIEAGTDVLNETDVKLQSVAESVAKLLRTHAEAKAVTIRTDFPRDLPRLHADERKVRQVLINLMNNAVKFNVRGGEVRVSARADDKGMWLDIADTGIGIEEKDIPRVLTRFGQVDSDLNRKYDGVGIGLPLSQALVRQHGGELLIESAPGKGTTVTVHFPPARIVPQD